MAFRWKNTLTHADATPEPLWLNRRAVLAGMAGAGTLGGSVAAQESLEPNTWEEITTYNNFYEFGTGKSDPSDNAGNMVTDGWEITIDGLVDNPGTFSLADLTADMTMEERLYRFRCVEAWSMVIPWNGFELADLLNKAGVALCCNISGTIFSLSKIFGKLTLGIKLTIFQIKYEIHEPL